MYAIKPAIPIPSRKTEIRKYGSTDLEKAFLDKVCKPIQRNGIAISEALVLNF
jgi:hypothetical protein